MAEAPEDTPQVYAVRLTDRAANLIVDEFTRLSLSSGTESATQWQSGIMTAIYGLATYPNRCPIAPEDRLFPDTTIRQFLHRRGRGPTWRILFTVHEADENDAPTVRIQYIRHGAQAPMIEWPSDGEED